MIAPLHTLLLAATLALSQTAPGPDGGPRLGSPITLESAKTSPIAVVPEAPDDALEESAAPVPDAGEHPPTNDIERQELGRPRGIVSAGDAGDTRADFDSGGDEHRIPAFASIRDDAWQVLSALAAVVGLIFFLRTLVLRGSRRLAGGGRPSGVLEVLARYPIARGQHLVLIKLARRILLIYQNGSAMTMLSEVSDRDEVAALLGRIEAGSARLQEASRFRTMLRQFSQEHDRASQSTTHSGIRDAWESGESGEIVDLTRQPTGAVRRLLGRTGGAR